MNREDRFLCFNLGEEEFALPLLTVREVIGTPKISKVPQSASHFLGIMDLRGLIISVVDLRIKFNLKPTVSDETTIIILDMQGYNLGIMVDQVNAVIELGATEISEKPSLNSSKLNEAVKGIFRKDNRLVLIIEIAKVLSNEDKNTIARAS